MTRAGRFARCEALFLFRLIYRLGVVAALCTFAVVSAPATAQQPGGVERIEISAEPIVSFDPREPARVNFGALSFRGGRYSTGPLVRDWLRARGFIADASALPYSSWTDDGAPDYRTRDTRPAGLPGEPGLWEIPLSYGYTRRPFGFWRRALAAGESKLLRPLRIVGALSKFGIVEKAWLNFENPLGEKMPDLIRVLRKMNAPYLCFTLHSSSLLPGGSPYAPNPAAVEHLFRTLTDTLERRRRGMAWALPICRPTVRRTPCWPLSTAWSCRPILS